ncbi:22223_t:CDS:1, partial [Racocetra persica]
YSSSNSSNSTIVNSNMATIYNSAHNDENSDNEENQLYPSIQLQNRP